LRARLLNLPVMVAVVLSLVWRQVPSVAELTRLLARERLLWAPPLQVTAEAVRLRLRCLPGRLFGEVFAALVPSLLARARARARPLPAVIAQAQAQFGQVWLVDASTLEEVFRKVGVLAESEGKLLGGKLLAVVDLASKLPLALWLDADAAVNEKRFLDRLKQVLTDPTLLVFDSGFYAFPFFDWLSEHGQSFVTRGRDNMACAVTQVMTSTPYLRDRLIRLGHHSTRRCQQPIRLVEVCVEGKWRAYLTNVLDPNQLPATDVVALYGQRWRIEEAFQLVKRLLGLSYLWSGAENEIEVQVWATWLLYAVLVDLSDAVAEELNLPLERLSLEMVYRGLYHFVGAYHRGEATDPIAYLAAQSDLGIVKRRRKYRERIALDKQLAILNL
jgi:hypothetical protein